MFQKVAGFGACVPVAEHSEGFFGIAWNSNTCFLPKPEKPASSGTDTIKSGSTRSASSQGTSSSRAFLEPDYQLTLTPPKFNRATQDCPTVHQYYAVGRKQAACGAVANRSGPPNPNDDANATQV
jgi:hypothetical protein